MALWRVGGHYGRLGGTVAGRRVLWKAGWHCGRSEGTVKAEECQGAWGHCGLLWKVEGHCGRWKLWEVTGSAAC